MQSNNFCHAIFGDSSHKSLIFLIIHMPKCYVLLPKQLHWNRGVIVNDLMLECPAEIAL
jgi:hypothetical protein